MMRLRRHCIWRSLLIASLAVLGASEAAQAHVGGKLKGFVSTVTGFRPEIVGVRVVVVGGGTQLRLSNRSGQTVVIFGYQHDPYLRFSRSVVAVNMHSPTSFATGGINSGKAMPPRPSTKPLWRKVARGVTYTWHDNRIHWGGEVPPDIVKAAPEQAHRIRNWNVSGQANGRDFAIAGVLDYVPPPGTKAVGGGGSRSWPLPVALGGAGLLAAAFVVARRKRRARRPGAAGS
jgi:hypothetical protein